MNTSSMDLAHSRVKPLVAHGTSITNTPDDRADRRQYQCFYVLCFALFLVVALVCRVLPRAWRPFTLAGEKRSSVINEVHNAVSAVLPFVFMG